MIFGITLKHFARLMAQGEQAKASKRTQRLLLKTSTKQFKVRSIQDLTFADFVDLERFYNQNNYYEFCIIFVRTKFWQRVYLHNMPMIMLAYGEQKKQLFEANRYIFDPPQYGEPGKETIGSEVRREFVDEFGNYVILMDVVCKGEMSKYKEVEQWKVSEFFFWANYLTGQKIIENIK